MEANKEAYDYWVIRRGKEKEMKRLREVEGEELGNEGGEVGGVVGWPGRLICSTKQSNISLLP